MSRTTIDRTMTGRRKYQEMLLSKFRISANHHKKYQIDWNENE